MTNSVMILNFVIFVYNMRFNVHLGQVWAIILPEGPHWVVDLNERTSQVVPDANPPNEDRRLS